MYKKLILTLVVMVAIFSGSLLLLPKNEPKNQPPNENQINDEKSKNIYDYNILNKSDDALPPEISDYKIIYKKNQGGKKILAENNLNFDNEKILIDLPNAYDFKVSPDNKLVTYLEADDLVLYDLEKKISEKLIYIIERNDAEMGHQWSNDKLLYATGISNIAFSNNNQYILLYLMFYEGCGTGLYDLKNKQYYPLGSCIQDAQWFKEKNIYLLAGGGVYSIGGIYVSDEKSPENINLIYPLPDTTGEGGHEISGVAISSYGDKIFFAESGSINSIDYTGNNYQKIKDATGEITTIHFIDNKNYLYYHQILTRSEKWDESKTMNFFFYQLIKYNLATGEEKIIEEKKKNILNPLAYYLVTLTMI